MPRACNFTQFLPSFPPPKIRFFSRIHICHSTRPNIHPKNRQKCEGKESIKELCSGSLFFLHSITGAKHELSDKWIQSITTTREKLFDFVQYVPDQNKLLDARKRVEDENKLNVDEFDPDLANDAGIYNPIILPWKNRT